VVSMYTKCENLKVWTFKPDLPAKQSFPSYLVRANLKKKTSINLLKITWIPPLTLLSTYLLAGVSFEVYSYFFLSEMQASTVEKNLMYAMKQFHESHRQAISIIFYSYTAFFYTLVFINFPFLATLLYINTGFYKIAPRDFHVKFVRNNRILFWDEVVEQIISENVDNSNGR
jgi:hypothetical protein